MKIMSTVDYRTGKSTDMKLVYNDQGSCLGLYPDERSANKGIDLYDQIRILVKPDSIIQVVSTNYPTRVHQDHGQYFVESYNSEYDLYFDDVFDVIDNNIVRSKSLEAAMCKVAMLMRYGYGYNIVIK